MVTAAGVCMCGCRYDLASKKQGPVTVKAYMEGPYGELAINQEDYTSFLLVTGGIGVTPLQSICNALLEQFSRGRELKYLRFLWSVRWDLVGTVWAPFGHSPTLLLTPTLSLVLPPPTPGPLPADAA